VKRVTRLVYGDHVWAIVGGIDGPTTHLAEQVVAKARLPLVSPVSTDKTVNLANVPWMFSLAPPDDQIASALAPRIVDAVGDGPLILISANDHDSCLLTRELRRELTRLQKVPAFQYEFNPNADSIDDMVAACLAGQPKLVIAVADEDVSWQVVRVLRSAGFRGPIAGGPGFGYGRFLRRAAESGGQLLYPALLAPPANDPLPAIAGGFSGQQSRSYQQNTALRDLSRLPFSDVELPDDFDFTARQAFDAVQLVVQAIRVAGLSRAEIGRALHELSPCCGVSGRIEWNGLGSNLRPPGVTSLPVDGDPQH